MSKAAKSLFVFAIYLFISGIILMTVPKLVLNMFGYPMTNEVWVRIIGLLLFLLGFYYIKAARHELLSFFKWSVQARSLVLIFFLVVTVLGLANPLLMVFGVIDFLGAIWTWKALRS